MSGILGDIENVVGDVLGGGSSGGGDPLGFLSELLNAIDGGDSNSQSSGGSSTGSEIGSIIQDIAPIALAFL